MYLSDIISMRTNSIVSEILHTVYAKEGSKLKRRLPTFPLNLINISYIDCCSYNCSIRRNLLSFLTFISSSFIISLVCNTH